ncbi:MAG: hypothetical protein ACRENP_24630, partial [Longimicrobiales bacterium]
MHRVQIAMLSFAALAATSPVAAQTSFGRALVVGEGEVIVGEPASGNAFRPGRVYIYRKVEGVWREAARLSAPEAQRADGFGSSLALSGSTLFVGERDGSTIRVFNKAPNGTWRAASTIATSTSVEGALGPMVAFGDYLLLGLPGRALGGRGGGGGGRGGQPQANLTPGAAVVLQRGADGEYMQRIRLAASDASAGDSFGASIAVDNDVVLIGAPGAKERAGTVYAFRLDPTTRMWQQGSVLQPREPQANEAFGSSIAMQGDAAVIGSPGAAANYGLALVFRRNKESGEWTEESRLTAFTGNRQERFGASIAAAGPDIWVSVPGRSVQSGGAQRRP